MQIVIEPYNPAWPAQFAQIKDALAAILSDFNPRIEHIGSTAVPGLAAKPIIDIQVGIPSTTLLDKTVQPMLAHYYLYYELFNADCPARRLFVGLKDPTKLRHFQQIFTAHDEIPHDLINPLRLCHVHIWEFGTPEWTRHIAFREYLKNHPAIAHEYGQLKKQLSQKNWEHGMAYNDAKNHFIKTEERKALLWFQEREQ